jgi:uncharacterized protein (DUF488 family)
VSTRPTAAPNRPPSTVWTIGHSTRPLEVFLGLLDEYRIETIADVRSHPGSRRFPHYGSAALETTLAGRGIAYRWLPALGGRRRPLPDSPNTAWRNASFRGYADYMQGSGFATGIDELRPLATRSRTALMCAEAVWWRCHRALIADYLCSIGTEVLHIMDSGHALAHPYTAPARIVDGRLSYAQAGPD